MSQRHSLPGFLTAAFLLAALSVFPGRAAGPEPARDSGRNSLGIGLAYVSPDVPLGDSAGVMVRYTRSFSWGRKKKGGPAEGMAASGDAARSFLLDAGLTVVDLDRADDGTAPAGTVSLTQISMGLLRTIASRGGWSFAAGGGLDYFLMDAESSFRSSPGLGIKSRYEADNGVGFHGQFEIIRAINPRVRFFVTLRYLVASLDGTHRFIVSGVPGSLDSVDFDLGGPQVGVGFAWRF